jgi:hypothetical protein
MAELSEVGLGVDEETGEMHVRLGAPRLMVHDSWSEVGHAIANATHRIGDENGAT